MTCSPKDFCTAAQSGLRIAAVLVLLPLAVGIAKSPSGEPAAQPAFGVLPLYFEAAPRQTAAGFEFVARGRECNFFVAPTEAVLTLTKADVNDEAGLRQHPAAARVRRATRELRLEFLGANATARVSGVGELPGQANYFLGNEAAQWRTGVPLFGRVRVEQLYPGVDLVYYGNERRLEYDFVVAPDADPNRIALRFAGADKIQVNAAGDLIFTLGQDEIRQPKPVVFQTVNGRRKLVAGEYVLTGRDTVTFRLGDYDRELPLVIDPVLSYSSFFGGSGADVAWDVAVDADGFIYVTGESMGGLPVRSGTVTNAFSGSDRLHGDAFVAKFDNAGTNLIYLAYIGGRVVDVGLSVAVDAMGSAYVTGYTESTNFPTTNALFTTLKGKPYLGLTSFPPDAFVAKLSPDGSALLYSTYLGGDLLDVGSGIAIDSGGNAYVAGYTESTNFATANADPTLTNYSGAGDAFVAKLGPAGTNLIYSLYLGGASLDVGWDVAAGAEGVAIVTGSTRSTNFSGAINFPLGGADVFVTSIDPASFISLTNLASYYFGGSRDNEAYRVTQAAESLYLVGATTEDAHFPVSPGELNPGGVYRSDNGAANWSDAGAGLPSVVATALAVDPANPNQMFAGTWHGVARSVDGGATWTAGTATNSNSLGRAPTIMSREVFSVAVLGGTPLTVLAGTVGEGVYRSTDGGVSWLSTTGWVSQSVAALAVVPSAPATVYAGTDGGVYKSTDGGLNWNVFNSGMGSVTVFALAVDPNNAQTIYAGTAGGVFRTTNGGTNWTTFNTGLANLTAQALAVHPTSTTTLFVGTAGGTFISTNAATNWANISVGLSNNSVTALVIDPATPSTLYAGTTNGVFKSVSGGVWTNFSTGLAARHVLSLAINPTAPATLYAGTRGRTFRGGSDVFVAKLNTADLALQYSAVWGGDLLDKGSDVAIDAAGRAHVTGRTLSANFPAVEALGILRATNSGGQDAFVAQLSSDGRRLEHSAYLGGSGTDSGYGIALDTQGSSFVVGATASANFPIHNAYQTNASGGDDAFLVKVIGESRPVLTISANTNAGHLALVNWPTYWTGFTLQTIDNFSRTNVVITNTVGTNVIVSTNLVLVNQWQDITSIVPWVTNGNFEVGVRSSTNLNSLFIRLRR